MPAALLPLNAAGQVLLNDAAVVAGDPVCGGLSYNAATGAVRATSGAPSNFIGGFGMASGRLSYVDCTAGFPGTPVWHNGLPFYNGQLCVSLNGEFYYQNGIGFALAPDGAVSALVS
jgi:hypothetical protein